MPRDIEKHREWKRLYYLARKAGSPGVSPFEKVRMVGIPTVKDRDGVWLKCVTVSGVQYRTASYELWKGVSSRCINSTHVHSGAINYLDVEMHPDFVDFQKFANWHTEQIGYGHDGYQLDKDILVQGNRVYGPDTCALVPRGLNAFYAEWPGTEALPRGVRCDKPRIKCYRAQITRDGRNVHLGRYYSIEEASAAYQEARKVELSRWLSRFKSGELPVDPRVVQVLERTLYV